jgi:hypothetical protein
VNAERGPENTDAEDDLTSEQGRLTSQGI